MGLIQWDGIYGESDTFLSEEDVAAAIDEAEALLRERRHHVSDAVLADLDEARRRRLQRRAGPHPAS
jgi:hypothetical protein